ncbi:Abhydrolase_6 domain-containing protein [Cephalotus follicularis]|uniref:Abhydrolase_6 domain-containing protein n=1 Tax=Cephalotus follicularis TaxID=3775 RepID=A0A1Q3BPL2_CEPFO|nr:Abhydrolase_6 domain-containing protein [Cephalotus follicularis]
MLHPIAEANETTIFGSLTPDEFYSRHSVTHSSDFITDPRGLKLFTQWWTPLPPTKPIGFIAVIHGYTGVSSWLIQLTSVLFASSGFVTCAIDHQGHGLSDGLPAYIPDINPVVDDCILFFDAFRKKFAANLPAFLYTESLGGAIGLYITLRQKGVWDGLVLNGAMCGVSPKFKPPWPLELLLPLAAPLIPTWKWVPTRGTIAAVSFKEEWKKKLAIACPNRYMSRPRVGTALEFLRVCQDLQGKFEEVDVPFLIVHGAEDVVCDPRCVEDLYKRAASRDKSIKIYEGMWHQMVGEPQENCDLVFGDVVEWLKSRAHSHKGKDPA